MKERVKLCLVSAASSLLWACSEPPTEPMMPGQESPDASSDRDLGEGASDLVEMSDVGVDRGEDQGAVADQGASVDLGEDMAPDMAPVDMSVDQGPSQRQIYVAQGHLGRITLSCDEGQSWIHDTSYDDTMRCYDDLLICAMGDPLGCDCEGAPDTCAVRRFDCDHNSQSGTGITFGNGWFVQTRGWGHPGGILRSADGVTWEQVVANVSFAGPVFTGVAFIVAGRSVRRSIDDGATWSEPIRTTLDGWNVRHRATGDYQGESRVVLLGEPGDITLSSDHGQTWWDAESFPTECGYRTKAILLHQARILIFGEDGVVCVSEDGGKNFVSHQPREAFPTTVLIDGRGLFLTWIKGERLESSDGLTWSELPLTPDTLLPTKVVRGEGGTLVAYNSGGFAQWYEKESFYRSTDNGLTWEVLDPSRFTRSHVIRDIAVGTIPADSAACAP